MILTKSARAVSSIWMKGLFFIGIGISFFLLIGCKKETTENLNTKLQKNQDSLIQSQQKNESKVVQEDFHDFIEMFSQKREFQLERVQFPLPIQVLDDNFELQEIPVNQEKYTFLNFILPDDFLEYKQNIFIDSKNAKIEQRGLNNGYMIDYFFENKNGKWYLKSWIDASP
ncbi:DUF4348 domain-containing protein [Flavobacterium sp. NRK F7]|uniref:DUF4348 domain-containing protein n=1 Tax=Flavobacterium sp. NRK F7 TaxID=2954930 RepID=UPI0020913BE6|nr:DUF4348 domain-containing protein [Flavobacterium sp. NRK F7]MCO6164125.1 DUF4348 domain-containing protein [Flavobacterium sp. NRK F7]